MSSTLLCSNSNADKVWVCAHIHMYTHPYMLAFDWWDFFAPLSLLSVYEEKLGLPVLVWCLCCRVAGKADKAPGQKALCLSRWSTWAAESASFSCTSIRRRKLTISQQLGLQTGGHTVYRARAFSCTTSEAGEVKVGHSLFRKWGGNVLYFVLDFVHENFW